MSRILITGGAGFAGSHLLDLLTAEPHELLGWYHPDSQAPDRSRVSWRPVNLLDAGEVARAAAEAHPDQVYHLAGAASQAGSWAAGPDALRVNALGTHHLLTALVTDAPHARVLVTGSATVYRPSDDPLDEQSPVGPTSPYGLSKLAQELVALHSNATTPLSVVVSRSFNHIGPRQSPDFFASSFARQLARIARGDAEPCIHVGNLTARRDLTDVRDTVRAYRLLMSRGRRGEIYNVCAGRTYQIDELLRTLIGHSGLRVEVRVDPARLRPSDQPVLVGNNEKLSRETGWLPAIPMDQTLADLYAYWRSVGE